MRSPSRQVRTSSPASSASGVERREVGPGGLDRARMELGADLPGAEPGEPGHAQGDRRGGRSGLDDGGAEADGLRFADRPQAAAELDLAALRTRRKPHDLGRALAPERDLTAGGALGERAQGEPLERRVPAGERLGGDADGRRHRPRHRRAPRAPPARAAAASSASSARVSAMFRSAAGLTSRSTGSTSARIRLRAKVVSSFVSSSANGSPAATASSRIRSRSSPSSGRITRPFRGESPSSAREPGEAASR